MPLRIDMLDRLAGYEPKAIDTSEWIDGHYFTISLKGTPTSNESGAHGVILIVNRPVPDLLYQFANLDPLRLQYGDATIKFWHSLIARAVRAINAGNYTSPASDMLIYSNMKPCRYPSREMALDRLYNRHVNFLRAVDEKSGAEGGIKEDPFIQNRVNAVLAELQIRFSGLATQVRNNVDGGAVIDLDGQIFGVIDLDRPDAASSLRSAGFELAVRSGQNTAQLMAMSNRADELSDQLSDELALLRNKMGVSVTITASNDAAVIDLAQWIKTANR